MLHALRFAALASLLGVPALAQQSMFNVPAGTGTVRGGFFFQEQLNLSQTGESNLSTAVGVGGGLELGLNLFHVSLYGPAHPAQSGRNLLMANAVLTLDRSEWLTLQLGGHAGFGRRPHQETVEPAGFAYLVGRFHSHLPNLAVVAGAYAATESYLGHGWPAGPLLGVEYELVDEWLVLQGDLLMGDHEAGVGVLGAVLLLPHGWQLALGVQVPSPFSKNPIGAVVELTKVPPDHEEHPADVSWERDRMTQRWLREHREAKESPPAPPRKLEPPPTAPSPEPERPERPAPNDVSPDD